MVGQQHVALVTQEDGTQQQVREYNDIMHINILQITSEDAHHIQYVKQTLQKSLKTTFFLMVTSGDTLECKMTSDP